MYSVMRKQRPDDISAIFGKLHLSHCIIYTLYRKLVETQPELAVLADVASVLTDAERELSGYIDQILNPQDYEKD